jgi:hypothetical protein
MRICCKYSSITSNDEQQPLSSTRTHPSAFQQRSPERLRPGLSGCGAVHRPRMLRLCRGHRVCKPPGWVFLPGGDWQLLP